MLKTGKKLLFVTVMIHFLVNAPVIAEEPLKKRMFVSPQDIGIEKAVDRAKKTVRMIDDMYKTFIVLVTKEYVTDPTMFSRSYSLQKSV